MTSCQYTLQAPEPADPSSNAAQKYSFVVEWYDPVAQIVKKFLMTFYTDKTVELYDLKNHRIFLRRCKPEGLELGNLYKSATITIMSRQMKIVDYADLNTKKKFEVELTHTFCMVKPDVIDKIGEIVSFMLEHGFKVVKMKMGQMSSDCVSELYSEHLGKSFFPSLISFLSSGPSVGLLVIGENAQKRWREYIGPMDSEIAKRTEPNTLRAIYGTDITRNAVHGSKEIERVPAETSLWFPESTSGSANDYVRPTCVAVNTTCCIIKPHALLEGMLGGILSFITERGFKITALEMFTLDTSTAEEFLEVYKGVVPEYAAMVVQLTSGPCVAMELLDSKNPGCTQETFRKLTGPTDPEIARKLRPDTIRAKFGKTKVLNAVHCTDLPDDAILEVEYFFKVLQI